MNINDAEKINEHLKEIGDSIFEAKSAYTIWKTIAYSRSIGIVSENLAHKYVDAQNTAPAFFVMIERASLATFVIFVLQSFDKDKKAHSFFKVNTMATEEFIKENQEIFDALKLSRDKIFAHRDMKKNTEYIKITIPSIDKLDIFFENFYSFYNKLTSKHQNSSTIFEMSTNDLLREMELMFMNLTRGEVVRKAEIEMEWMWEKDDKKISDVFRAKNNKLS